MHMHHEKYDALKTHKGVLLESMYSLMGRDPCPHQSKWGLMVLRLTPSIIASPALPGRTVYVDTRKSTDSRISSVLGKATDTHYSLNLWRNCHEASAPQLLTRSKEGKGRREDVTLCNWIQTCTFFMSCFLPQNVTWLYGRFLTSRMEPMSLCEGPCPQVLTWNSSD